MVVAAQPLRWHGADCCAMMAGGSVYAFLQVSQDGLGFEAECGRIPRSW